MAALGVYEDPAETDELDSLIEQRAARREPQPQPEREPQPELPAPTATPPAPEAPALDIDSMIAKARNFRAQMAPGEAAAPPLDIDSTIAAARSGRRDRGFLSGLGTEAEAPDYDAVIAGLRGERQASTADLLPGLPAGSRRQVTDYLDLAQRMITQAEAGLPPGARTQPGGPSPIDETAPGRVPLSESLVPNQFGDKELNAAEALAACGPVAAVAFARATGRNPTLREALDLAKGVGWTAQHGMAGPQSQVQLLEKMGVRATLENTVDWGGIRTEVEAGRPVIVDTPGHYFVAVGYDAESGKFNFGASGTALARGSAWMTPEQVGATGMGAPRSTIYLSQGEQGAAAAARFSPYDDTFRKYAGGLASNPEFIAIVAAGTKAESKWDAGDQSGDSGKSWGLFQIHQVHLQPGDNGQWRLDPDQATAYMMPRYIAAYNRLKAEGLSGADLASAVAAEAERPAGWNDPNSEARNNYRNAYQAVTLGAPPAATPTTSSSLTRPIPAVGTAGRDAAESWLQATAGMLTATPPAFPYSTVIPPIPPRTPAGQAVTAGAIEAEYGGPPPPQLPPALRGPPGESAQDRADREEGERMRQAQAAAPPPAYTGAEVPYGEGFGPGEGTRAAQEPQAPGVPLALTGAGGATISPAGPPPQPQSQADQIRSVVASFGDALAGIFAPREPRPPEQPQLSAAPANVLGAGAEGFQRGFEATPGGQGLERAVPALWGTLQDFWKSHEARTEEMARGGPLNPMTYVHNLVGTLQLAGLPNQAAGNVLAEFTRGAVPLSRGTFIPNPPDWLNELSGRAPGQPIDRADVVNALTQAKVPVPVVDMLAQAFFNVAAKGIGRVVGRGAARAVEEPLARGAEETAAAAMPAPPAPPSGAEIREGQRVSQAQRRAGLIEGVTGEGPTRVEGSWGGRAWTPEERAQRIAAREPLTVYDTPEIMELRYRNYGPEAIQTADIRTPERTQLRQQIDAQAWSAAEQNVGGLPDGVRRSDPIRYEGHVDLIIGVPASGKSGLAKQLERDHGAMTIDADNVKRLIPEYIQSNGELAGLVHKESSEIAEDLVDRAVRQNANVVIPVVAKNAEQAEARVEALRSLGKTVDVHYVDLPIRKAAGRIMERFYAGDQGFVDIDYLVGQVGRNPRDAFGRIIDGGNANAVYAYSSDVPRGAPLRRLDPEQFRPGASRSEPGAAAGGEGARLGYILPGGTRNRPAVSEVRPPAAEPILGEAPTVATEARGPATAPAAAPASGPAPTVAGRLAARGAPEIGGGTAGAIAGAATGEEDEQGQRDVGATIARAALFGTAGFLGTGFLRAATRPYKGSPTTYGAKFDAMLNQQQRAAPGGGFKAGVDYLVRQTFDRGTDLAQMEARMDRMHQSKFGTPLPPEALTEALFRTASSGSENVAAVKQQQMLFPAIRGLSDVQLADLNRYLVAQDNIDKANRFGAKGAQRMFSGGITAQESATEAADILATPHGGKINASAHELYNYMNTLRDRMVQSGMWDQNMANDLKRDFPHYIKAEIIDYMKDPSKIAVGSKISAPDRLLHELTEAGTERGRVNPIASLQRMGFEVERMAMRNEAAQALLSWQQLDPATFGNVMRQVPASYAPTNAEATIDVFVKGVHERYAIAKPFDQLVTFPSVGGIDNAILDRLLKTPASLIRAGATERNPLFALGANPVIDFPQYLFSEASKYGLHNSGRVLWNYTRGMYDAFHGILTDEIKGAAAQRFLLGGGGQGETLVGAGAKRVGPQEAATNPIGRFFTESKTAESIARRGGTEHIIETRAGLYKLLDDILLFGWVPKIGGRLELGPRVGAMLNEETLGRGPGLRAIMAGREATQDFALGGELTKTVNQYIPYFNVATQPANWLYKLASRNPKGFIAAATGFVGVPAVVTTAWNHSDPERERAYNDIPNSDKAQGAVIVLPTPWREPDAEGRRKPNYVLIPLRDLAGINTLARVAAERAMTGRSPSDWKEVLSDVAASASPLRTDNGISALGAFIPATVGVPLQLATDRDWWRGSWIGTEFNNDRATLPAKAIAGLTGAEPAQVEFAARGFGGGLAGTVLSGIDMAMRKASGQPLTTPGAGIQEQPIIGGLASRFYRRGGGQAELDLRGARDNFKTALITEWKQNNPGATTKQIESATNRAGDAATEIIYNTNDLPSSWIRRARDAAKAAGATPEEYREILTQVRDALARREEQGRPRREYITGQYSVR